MRKRVLSLCMALAMCLSLLPVQVLAEDIGDITQSAREMANAVVDVEGDSYSDAETAETLIEMPAADMETSGLPKPLSFEKQGGEVEPIRIENGRILYGSKEYYIQDNLAYCDGKALDTGGEYVHRLVISYDSIYAEVGASETGILLDDSLSDNAQLFGASENEAAIYDFAKNTMKLSAAAICGLLGSLYTESSSFNPNATFYENNGRLSYGICQWNTGRLEDLKNYCSANGYDYQSLTGQLRFMKYELEGKENAAYNAVRDVPNTRDGAYESGKLWGSKYERCASIYIERRGERARDVYWPKYSATFLLGSAGEDVIETALSYEGKRLKDMDSAFQRMVNGADWCGYFVWWCGYKAGLVDSGLYPPSNSFSTAINPAMWVAEHSKGKIFIYNEYLPFFKERPESWELHPSGSTWGANFPEGAGTIESIPYSFLPQKGDIIICGYKVDASPYMRFSHTGYVRENSVDASVIYTIEGNTSNPRNSNGGTGVYAKTRHPGHPGRENTSEREIIGYVRPNYHNHSYNSLGECTVCGEEYHLDIKEISPTTIRVTAVNSVSGTAPAHTLPYGDANITSRYSIGNSVTVNGYAYNCFNNLWWRLSDSGTWLNADYLDKAPSMLSISGQTYPTGNLPKGRSFGLAGAIESNYAITEVSAHIYIQGTNNDARSPYIAHPNRNRYDIYTDGLDSEFRFGELSDGYYTYVVTAIDAFPNTKTLIRSDFTVGNKAPSMLSISGQTYPTGNLQRGRSFGLAGIIESNYAITEVSAHIYIQGTNNDARSPYIAHPNRNRYDIYTDGLDSEFRFGELSDGHYTYVVTATDGFPNTQTLVSSDFTIGNPPVPPNAPSVTVNGHSVTVSWNAVENATHYDAYLVREPWGWSDIKYSSGAITQTTFTFDNVAEGAYCAFVISRPNANTVQSGWTSLSVNAPAYYLDVNAYLDGASAGNLGDYGTVDIYINGSLVADDVSDYYQEWPSGTNYEIRDIKPKAGYSYNGVYEGARTGSIESGTVNVTFNFSKIDTENLPKAAKTATFNKHTYSLYSEPVTWYAAKLLCEAMGGHLVTIASAEENNFVLSLRGPAWVWIGATDSAKEEDWKWVTGEAVEFDRWAPGEPNNSYTNEEYGENYAQQIYDDGTWNDSIGCGKYAFICEIDSVVPERYAVTYDANGGSGTMSGDTATAGVAFTLPPNGFTPPDSGKEFEAWSINGTNYQPGETYVFTADATVFAMWKDKQVHNPQVGIENQTASPGSTFTVPVLLRDNPGVITADFWIDYDKEYLTLTEVEDGGILGTPDHGGDKTLVPYHLYWHNDTSTENFRDNGTIATLTFQVSEGAPDGNYPITIIPGTPAMYDVDLTPYTPDVQNGIIAVSNIVWGDAYRNDGVNAIDVTALARYVATGWPGFTEKEINLANSDVYHDNVVNAFDVTVLARHIATGWKAYEQLPFIPASLRSASLSSIDSADLLPNPVIKAEEEAEQKGKIQISLEHNPGVIAVNLWIDYDKEYLTLTEVEDGGILGTTDHGGDKTERPYHLYWHNDTSRENFRDNGTIATLIFQVNEGAPDGNYPITIIPGDPAMYDVDLKTYTPDIQNGSISVPHNLTKVEAVAPTCETDGNIEYWTCSKCGKLFRDAEGESEITRDETVLKATGHDWGEWIPGKPGEETRTCKNDPSHTETRGHVHNLTKVEAVAPTCETDGNIEYWTCSECGKLFRDAEGESEITRDETVLKATGHDWGEWVVTKSATEETEGEKTRTCRNDASHTETRTISIPSPNGGCYVATSVYGSYDCPEVWTLRRFRDDVLAQTWYGRLFIRLYYAVSPTAVKLFGDCQWFQNFFRDRLDKMVSELQADGFESTPYEDRAW